MCNLACESPGTSVFCEEKGNAGRAGLPIECVETQGWKHAGEASRRVCDIGGAGECMCMYVGCMYVCNGIRGLGVLWGEVAFLGGRVPNEPSGRIELEKMVYWYICR